ncbi:cytochrome c oxidase subunit II [Candidatus Njordibacter sp. Uisw_002]|uniref:cytochrome c oxidase subunit II n=1 Tax=Candidatus Njordibacter sp. Uisw_002 TaxID=3230971 RepID=UPI003D4E986C
MYFRTWQRLSSVVLGLVLAPAAMADWGLNMPQGITEVSQSIFELHMLIFWICVWIGVVVFGVMFYSIFKHRKSKGAVASKFHESLGLEILWTAVPTVILIAMAVPATSVLIEMYDTKNSDVDIKITGHQWKWQYDYLGEDVGFFSNLTTTEDEIYNRTEKGENYLEEVDYNVVVPTGQKVRFLITSNDVIHSWWVPEIAVKKDAIPGYINESWTIIPEGQEGIYRGKCTELCGVNHGFMPIVLEAVTSDEYQVWLEEQRAGKIAEAQAALGEFSYDELMVKGADVYARSCAACHGNEGQGLGSVFPALAGSSMALNDMAGHIDIVLNGKPGSAMQSFSAQLSDVDIAAVITFERNAWGNDTGETVTPKMIIDAKK